MTSAGELGLTELLRSENPAEGEGWEEWVKKVREEQGAGGGAAATGRVGQGVGEGGAGEGAEQPEAMETDAPSDAPSDANAKADGGLSQIEAVLRKLHTLLLEMEVQEGKLVCGRCGFEYPIKDGVGNFLLPSHLV